MTRSAASRRFHEELDLLQARLMKMSGLAEDLVERAVDAFLDRDPEARVAISADDEVIDALELEIDEEVLRLIALHQPVASDLRQVLTTMMICTDVERVGDHAVNIAKAAQRVAVLPPLPEIPEMAELAVLSRRMLRDALAAYGSRNSGLARQVCARDDRVDDMRKTVRKLLTDLMARDPGRIGPSLEYLRVSQQLERIGDLSTNISENVVFLVEGHSIKHHAERAETEEASD
ncbi:MAG: phosphate signaling complex protein PhoU [Gemmatimonadota bacterium]|jgi:phosphate transport system protein